MEWSNSYRAILHHIAVAHPWLTCVPFPIKTQTLKASISKAHINKDADRAELFRLLEVNTTLRVIYSSKRQHKTISQILDLSLNDPESISKLDAIIGTTNDWKKEDQYTYVRVT